MAPPRNVRMHRLPVAWGTLLGVLLLARALAGESAVSFPGDGLIGYLPFDGHLRALAPRGEETTAEFSRGSQALTPAFQALPENTPRYLSGRFGQGIFLEPGYESGEKFECRNWLPPESAQLLPTPGMGCAYDAVGTARVALLSRAPGEPAGEDHRVLEGTHALRVECLAAGDGAVTAGGGAVLEGSYVLSLFARTDGDAAAEETVRIELVDADGTVLGAADARVSRTWRRAELPAAVGTFTRDTKQQRYRDLRVRVLGSRAGQVFAVDAVMLELCGAYSYAGMSGASSWLPGWGYRASEVLELNVLRYGLNRRTGSIAFWARTCGHSQAWRTLFEIASSNRWQPFLQLHLRPDTRLWLTGRKQEPAGVAAPVDIQPDTWHHYAVTWTAAAATMYLDGRKMGELDGLEIPALPPFLRLGSSGPNAPANAIIDEAVLYHRTLSAAEVAVLASRVTPLSAELQPPVTVGPSLFVGTVAHGLTPQTWFCEVRNPGSVVRRGLTVRFQLGGLIVLERRLRRLGAGATATVGFEFLPDLALGRYPLCVTVEDDGTEVARCEREIEVTPAPEPVDNLQVAPWGFNSERDYGLTCGGGDVEEAMRRGLHWAPLYHFLGYPRAVDGEDWVHDMNGKPFRASLTSPYIRAQVSREAERIARRYAAIPALLAVTLNSEMQWLWSHDYSDANVAWVRNRFGIDLNTWRQPPKGDVDANQTPFGRLKPSVAGLALPEDRVLSPQEPFYAYHRWFHGPEAPTESFLNQALGDAMHARRPDVLTIQEPILRRPAVQAFRRMSIGQEWFYYENPMAAVMVQECLNAAVRGTPLRPTGMPQFLFKAGGAAPYNAIATADLYHETVWLCALQPIRMFTYWNFGVVPAAGYENAYSKCMTKSEIDEFLGTPTPTWDQAKARLESRPEVARKLMPWTPELIRTFRHFHQEEVGPLAALIPQWHNRPRRLAIVRSFASQLYGEVRWPGTTWLENSAVYCGVPFDVLYDRDFESGKDPLDGYHMVIVSATVCLPRPAYQSLTRFAARGGAIAVDAETLVRIPGAVRVEPQGSLSKFEADLEAQAALWRERYGVSSPAYVEAMSRQAQASEMGSLVEPAFLALLTARVRAEARSLTPNTWLNLLEAEHACYIGVVNDLRVAGPMYGHFGRIRETGVPQIAEVLFDPELGSFAYDLTAGRPLVADTEVTAGRLQLELPAGGARLVLLLPRAIAQLQAGARLGKAQWGDHRGQELRIEAALTDSTGRRVPGLVPATVTITAPDGDRSDLSRHAVFRHGTLDCRVPVLRNGPTGTWRVSVVERASARAVETTVEVSR